MKVKYLKENFAPIVAESHSYAEICRKIGLADKGSNIGTIKKYIELYQLDTTHFTGQRWNKGASHDEITALVPLEEILKKNTNYKSDSLKKRLIKKDIKKNKCELCGISGDDIVLELHHIDGDHYNNKLENLQILCPNCHSKTDNFRGRNQKRIATPESAYIKKERPKCVCLNCGKKFISDRCDRERKFCNRECYNEYLKKGHNLNYENVPDITKESILKVIENYSDITSLGKYFAVSRTTMRKYLDMYGLLEEFKFKYEFKAKKIQQYDINMNLIKEWPSITDAEETLGIKGIGRVAKGERRSCGGFIWRFIN